MEGSDFRVLVVDDEKIQREMLRGFLVKQGFQVVEAEDGAKALEEFRKEPFPLILSDYRMPGMDGIQLLREIRRIDSKAVIILMTAYGTIETAVAAMKEGAYDYITKPIDLDELLLLMRRVEKEWQIQRENQELKAQLKGKFKVDFIISHSRPMEEALNIVGRAAASTATVLILGESGTGKELIARAIHYASARADHPLIKVNCAALPENLLESELFGHEKGAFTGAVSRRIGRFEQANAGSIFLDEIGDLTPAFQVKLLRVLQEKEFERIGSNQTLRIDVRVIAATHRNLEEAVAQGRFREDLYYRLNVVTIRLPPLRERKEDIPLLIEHFLKRHSEKNKRPIRAVSREARELLMRYDYPGNVRELENIIERAVVLCRAEVISSQDLPLHLQEGKSEVSLVYEPKGRNLPDTLEEIERELIQKALEKSGGIQTQAAEDLGVSERVLRYKMKKYKIKGKD